jgi:segregation and condensation protein B
MARSLPPLDDAGETGAPPDEVQKVGPAGAGPAAEAAGASAGGTAAPEGGGATADPGEPDEPGEPGDETGGDGGRTRTAEPRPTPPPLERLEGAVEAMLLASGEAMTAERLRDLLGLPSVVHVREAIAAIRGRFSAAGLAVELQDVAGGHRVVTRPEYAEYVRRLWRKPSADRLSPTLLETLSIVAYKQPVARVEVERIRGVQCGDALRGLLERRLVKVAGRSDQPGRPLLYATTARFLEVFGLATLDDLPNAKDLRL